MNSGLWLEFMNAVLHFHSLTALASTPASSRGALFLSQAARRASHWVTLQKWGD